MPPHLTCARSPEFIMYPKPAAGRVVRRARNGRRMTTEHDPGRLRERLPALVDGWRPGRRVAGLRPLVGGKSSLTYLVELDADEPIVVKMAPPGLAPTRNRDVLRQARVQDAIVRSGRAPVAAVCFTDAGDPPEVPPLYAMRVRRRRVVRAAARRLRRAARAGDHPRSPGRGGAGAGGVALDPAGLGRARRRARGRTGRGGRALGPDVRDGHRRPPERIRARGRRAPGHDPGTGAVHRRPR